MKVNRRELLGKLSTVISAVHRNETLEQSNCFVFTEGKVIGFSGDMYAEAECAVIEEPIAVPAYDLVALLGKFPDEEVSFALKNEQLVVTGKRKRAGLTVQNEILLPYQDIPKPGKMKPCGEGVWEYMNMAAKICEANNDNYRVSHVHIAPDCIQATDRFRFLRVHTDTGMAEAMVPAESLLASGSYAPSHAALKDGWLFLKSKEAGALLGMCCAEGDYFEKEALDGILELDSGSKVVLPDNIATMLGRASIMAEDGCDKDASIKLSKNTLIVKTQKESGWYEEKQKVKYDGEDMSVMISLSLFRDILSKTNEAMINESKIKMEKDGIEFVVALER